MDKLINGLIAFAAIFIVAPFLVSLVLVLIGRRSRRSDSSSPIWWFVLLALSSAVALVISIQTIGNPILYALGAAKRVQLNVTETTQPYQDHEGTLINGRVGGYYELDGARHPVADFRWTNDETLPEIGERVDVTIGPMWPSPLIEGPAAAIERAILGLLAGVAGGYLALLTIRERQRLTPGGARYGDASRTGDA